MSTLEIPTGFTSEQIQKLASGPYTEEDSMAPLNCVLQD
jgi:hypothetical protein